MSAGSGDHGQGRDCHYSSPVAASKLPDSMKPETETVEVSACARKPGIDSLARTSRHFASSSKSENCDDDECDHSDSGVFNSSKNTVGSGSDGDLTDDGERVGLLHYLPPKKSPTRLSDQDLASDLSDLERQCQDLPANRSMCIFTEKQNDIAYDAAFSVSSEENTSPRSQQECFPGDFLKAKEDFDAATEGTEMATIRDHSVGLTEEEVKRQLAADYNAEQQHRHEQEYDEVHSCSSDELDSVVVHQPSDSEDNGNGYNIHSKLYARPRNMHVPDTDVDPELDELEEPARSSKSCHSNLHYKNRARQSETDFLFTSVNTYGSTRRYNNSYTENRTSLNNTGSLELGSARRNVTEPNRTSERVHIEKTIKSRDCTKPPFGDPVRKEEIFHKTTERLIDPYKYNKRDIPNLPHADSLLRPEAEDKKEAEKKRKKKKKKASGVKDDGGDSDTRDTPEQDVNGNPVSFPSQPYSSKHNSSKLPNKSDPFPKHSRYPGSVCSFNGVGHGSPGPTGSEHDDMPTAIESKKQRRKAKKDKEQAGVIKADKIPGNRGEESVESLLDFIENTPTNKKKSKKSPSILGAPAAVSHSIAVEKVNGKKKKRNLLMNNTYVKDEKGSDIDNDYEQSSRMSEVSDERKDGLSESSADSDPSKDTHNINMLPSKLDLDETLNDPLALPAGLAVSNDGYIFTDFDKMPKPAMEEEFQVVGKRKKKFPPRDCNSMFTKDDSYWFKDDLKKKTKTLPRSMTPPPRPSQESSGERSFSPSAFPVLCSNRSREGRRNSTGNTVLEAGQDDSDLESVKSVPVAVDGLALIKSGSDSPEIVQEQSLAISYAKIAAAPRPKLAENTLSPTARRHSFGSGSQSATEMRESVDVNSSFPSLFNKDISGSSSERVPDSNVTVSVISGKSSRSSDSDNSGFSSDSKLSTTGPEDSTDRSLSCDSSEGDQNISTKESQSNSIVVFESVSQSVLVSTPTDTPTSGKNASPSAPKPSSEPDSSANRQASSGYRLVSSVSQSQTAPSTLTNKAGASKPPLPVRTSNNKRNNKTSKSVIFLDRKLNAPSRNLGISFGFDSELDVSLVDKLDATTLSSCSGSSNTNASRPSRPVVKQCTPDKESNLLSPNKALQNEDSNKTKVDRTKGVVLPPNGIVIPSAQEGSNIRKSTVTHKALSTALNLSGNKDNTISFTSAPAENLTVKRVVDYQDNCGSFDVESAVGFLLHEWDKVMKLREKDPDQVMYYK